MFTNHYYSHITGFKIQIFYKISSSKLCQWFRFSVSVSYQSTTNIHKVSILQVYPLWLQFCRSDVQVQVHRALWSAVIFRMFLLLRFIVGSSGKEATYAAMQWIDRIHSLETRRWGTLYCGYHPKEKENNVEVFQGHSPIPTTNMCWIIEASIIVPNFEM